MLALSLQEASAPSAGEIGAALRDVLARPEFQPPPPRPVQSLLARILAAIGRLISGLFERLADIPGGAAVDVILIVGLLAAVTLLVYKAGGAVRRRSRALRRPALTARMRQSVVERTPAEWEMLARQLAEEGRLREAALALYQSVLRRLVDAGSIRYHASKTPGDYRREVGGGTPGGGFAAFVRLFEAVAFGRVPHGQGEFQTLVTLAHAAAPRDG
ncbi:MAG: DUF4129 domain-containing protein [Gemmatimonadota bacterium]